MKKRVLSLLMALTLCLTTLPTAVFADVTENGEGSGGTHYVAESGGTQYETVQEILGNMEEGEITLLDSVTEDLTVSAATTIHMNGHSITGNIDATDSLTLNGGTVDGTVKVDGGTLNMTAPAEAEAAITGGLNVVSGSAFVSGAQVGVKGTLYFDGTDMLISGAVKAVELDSAAEPAAKTLYGSATVNGDTAAEAGFDTDTYKVGGEIAKKLTNKQVGSTTPAAPSLTLTETSKSLTAGKTAVFTANYTGTDTLNAYVQDNAVNGYFTISQKNNGDGTYTVSVKIDEETPGGTYTLFVHEVGNTSVQASATITVIGLPDAAEVNGKQYKSLPRALNAAQDGGTVTMLTTLNDDDTISFCRDAKGDPVEKTVTLMMNGHSLSCEGTPTLYIQSGKLIIGDEATISQATQAAMPAVFVDNNEQSKDRGTLEFQGKATLTGGLLIQNWGKLVDGLKKGTIITSNGAYSVSVERSKTYSNVLGLLGDGLAFAKKGNPAELVNGNVKELTEDVIVVAHTHSPKCTQNPDPDALQTYIYICDCGFVCPHDRFTNSICDICHAACTHDEYTSDDKCARCGAPFAVRVECTDSMGITSNKLYMKTTTQDGTDDTLRQVFNEAADGSTITLLANAMLPDGIYASKTLTLDLNGHSLSGYSLNVGGLTATSQVRTGKLTVIDSSGGNGAVGVTVRDGGTLVFDPKNDHTTLLQLEVWGGTVELYGGKISRSGLRLNNNITLGNLLPGQAGLAYYRDDRQLTLEEATSQNCDLVVKLCSHGGAEGFDNNSTACPYCNAPAVAETDLNNGEGNRLRRRFANLQTAIDADRDSGSTLYLLTDVTGDYTIDGTQDTGLNLNGHSIKGTVTVKAAAGSNTTTTLSNTKNTTTASIDKVVAYKGAKLAGSGYSAVIGTLTLADTTKWKDILYEPTRLGFKVTSADGTHQWYAPEGVNDSQLNNVIINSLPITTKTLNLKVNGKNLTGSSPKVERGTTVQLCASCNTNGATVEFSILKKGETTPITLTKPSYADRKYTKDYSFDTIGEYTIYFTATKDGYTVTSTPKKLTVTKASIPDSAITKPVGISDLTYSGSEQALITAGSVTSGGTMQYSLTENGTYSQDIPTGTDAGTYTVWYRVIGDANHNDTTPDSVAVRIGKKPLTITGVTAASKPYDGTTNADISSVTFDGVNLNRDTDYTVTASFDDAGVGSGKSITATVSLMGQAAKNYALEQSSFPTTGSITKAAAPTNIQSGSLNVINGTQQTYTYDFSKLLPELSEGEYGTISYGNRADISLVSQSGYYYDETIVEFKNGVLILAQFYAKDGTATGQIGTIKVNVTTTNYENFQLTLVLNAVNQIKPTPDGEITASEITYGDALSKSTISGKMKDPDTGKSVNGTFAWTDGTINPNAGDYEAEWTFTPAAGYEQYAIATGTVKVTIKPKSIEGAEVTLEQDSFVYDGNEKTPVAKSVVLNGVVLTPTTDYGYYCDMASDVGTHKLTVSGNNNYTGTATVEWRITPRVVITPTIELSGAPFTYTGSAIEPIVTVKDGAVVIPEGEYTVEYSNNTNAGTATVTVTNKDGGNYTVSGSTKFTIKPAALESVSVTQDGALTYNGSAQTATVTEIATAKGGQSVTFTYSATENGTFNAAVPSFTDAGTHTVYYQAAAANHETASGSFTVSIAAKAVNATIELSGAPFTYTGSAIEPTVTVKDGGTTISPSEYTVSYSDNTNAGTATVTVTNKDGGNYTVSGSKEFEIQKADPTVTEAPAANSLTYSGSAQALVTAGTASGGKMQYRLGESGNFSTDIPTAKDAGTYKVYYMVKGDSNHKDTGAVELTVTINKAALTGVSVKQDGALTYNGTAQTATVKTSTTAKGGQSVTFTYSATEDGTFNAAVPSFTDAGSHTVWYKAKANNHETESGSFDVTISKAALESVSVKQDGALTYNGTAQAATVKTSATAKGGQNVTFTYSTEKDGTFNAAVPSFTNAGTHTVWYKAEANNHETASGSFTVSIAAKAVTVTALDKRVYVGAAAPDLTKPEEGKDYTVEGLLGGDKLTTIPTLTYDPAPKTHRANKDTKIVASAADAGGNYEISYVPGTLVVVDVPDTGKPLEPHPVNTPAQSENGAVSANPKEATRGTNVIVSVKPDEGCRLGDLTVVDENGNALEVVDRGNGQYVFVMPDGAVTIRASFVRDGASEASPFRDVSTDAYYYEAIKWAVDRGVTGGIGDGLFGPNQSCTRAQIVTFLWRAAGSPEPKSAAAFADVPAGAYYAKAVAWAVENGITTGTSETTFSPNAACTRAQSVTFLFRALGKLTESGETFRDVPKGSYYEDAVAWAAANGITTGIGGGLFGPNQSCTRAQIVTFLYRAYQGR